MAAERRPTLLLNPTAAPRFARRPQHVGIEVTTRCQLRCRHCFNDSGQDRQEDLSLPVIVRVLDELAGWGLRLVRITGGEPTLHPRFAEILAACEARGLAVVLNTHGVYAADVLDWLAGAPVARFIISLDGLEASHDALRGRGTYRRALKSCRALVAAGRPVTLAYHASRQNRQDLPGLAALAAGLGAELKVGLLRPVGRAGAGLLGEVLSPPEHLELMHEVARQRRECPGLRILADFDILDRESDGIDISDARISCGAGRTLASLAATGDVYPCAFFWTPDRAFSAGNVHTETLAAIWERSPVLEPFRIHTKGETCQTCAHYQRRCAGGCPAMSYHLCGTLDARDPTCFAGLVGPKRGTAT